MSCAICFDDITQMTGRVELSCSHSFHYMCLTNWFGNQMSKDIEESCPCCRHVANTHERLPDMEGLDASDTESEFSYTPASDAAVIRAAEKYALLKSSLSESELKAYAATRINACARAFWPRRAWLQYKDLAEDKDLIRHRIAHLTRDLLTRSFQIDFHKKSLTLNRKEVCNFMATAIQSAWRGYISRKNARNLEARRIQVTWTRTADGWKRSVRIRGEMATWGGEGLPPQSLSFQMHCCAKKIQSAWRSFCAKRTVVWRQTGPRSWQRTIITGGQN